MQNVLFHRDYKRFTGGHLKVWHYFNHVRSSASFNPVISFTKESIWDKSNPWKNSQQYIIDSQEAIDPDILFLAGCDWGILTENQRSKSAIPIINLIQGLRHALPDTILYDYLKYKAVRICVSQEVCDALYETKQVNGPMYVIPNCLELEKFPQALDDSEKEIDLLIFSNKNQRLGQEIYNQTNRSQRNIHVISKHLPRKKFLSFINNAKTALFLPLYPHEGFFLPALEGMILNSLVICPDCVGNRSICIPGYNCFRPEYTLESILRDIDQAFELSRGERLKIIENGYTTANQHDISIERASFQKILNNIFQVW